MRKAATVFVVSGFVVALPAVLFKLLHCPWAVEMQILAGILIIIGVILIFISVLNPK